MYCLSMSTSMHFLIMLILGLNLALDWLMTCTQGRWEKTWQAVNLMSQTGMQECCLLLIHLSCLVRLGLFGFAIESKHSLSGITKEKHVNWSERYFIVSICKWLYMSVYCTYRWYVEGTWKYIQYINVNMRVFILWICVFFIHMCHISLLGWLQRQNTKGTKHIKHCCVYLEVCCVVV